MPNIIINRKTGKEVEASNAQAVMDRFPNQFTTKPGTKLNNEVAKAENALLSKGNDEIEADLNKITSSKDLENLLKEEKAGKNRKGAVAHIENRIAFLNEKISNPDS